LIKSYFKSFIFGFFQNGFKIECNESITSTLEEFVLELNPMETKAMQEALHAVHEHDN